MYVNTILNVISASITIIFFILSYSKISNIKFKLNIRSALVITCESIVVVLNTMYTPVAFESVLISLLSITIACYLIYKDTMSHTFLKAIIIYLILFICEILISSIVLFTNENNINMLNSNIYFKFIVSTLISFSCYFIFYLKRISKLVNKLLNHKFNKYSFVFIVVLLIFLTYLDIKYIIDWSLKSYISNFIIFICFLTIISIAIISNIKSQKEIEKTTILLEFMKKYEKTIDEDRINRHEMLNNLLMLKSYTNKNSKKYNDLLNELVDTYSKKDINPIRNIYNLPPGLKGVIYYKIKEAEQQGIITDVRISNDATKRLKSISNKEYTKVFKIISILLDNAVEAAYKSKEKLLLIEIVNIKGVLTILIENTIVSKVNIDKINNKNYSTKGKNRGLGLYIVKSLIRESNKISIEQYCSDDIFTTKVYIK